MVGDRDCDGDVVYEPLAVEHTEPVGDTVGLRVDVEQAELVTLTVGERLIEGLVV